jgi:sodium transport system permease protein
MKNRLLIIAKKELDRFFGDWRILLSTLIFPGVILYLMYAIVAPNVVSLLIKNNKQFKIYAINSPTIIKTILEQSNMDFRIALEEEYEHLKEIIKNKDEVIMLVFPKYFEEIIMNYDVREGKTVPEIMLYYNSLVKGSAMQYSKLLIILNAWESSFVNKFDINKSINGDLADSKEKSNNLLSVLLPMFLIMFMFYSAIAVTTAAITGEKEQGILTLLFAAPVGTRVIAAGKVFALTIETLLCGISGSLGIIFSLPHLIDKINKEIAEFNMETSNFIFNINIYSIFDYLYLILSLLSIACFIVIMIAIVSVYAKTVREAQMLLAPLIMLLMTMSIFATLYGNTGQIEWYQCFIPLYNTIKIISSIFAKDYLVLKVLLTALSNLFYSIFGTEILSRLFKSEKVIYGE